jgi:hypothetical protein
MTAVDRSVAKDFGPCLAKYMESQPLPQPRINDRPGLVGLGGERMTQIARGRRSVGFLGIEVVQYWLSLVAFLLSSGRSCLEGRL